MSDKRETVYVSAHALGSGNILRLNAEVRRDDFARPPWVLRPGGWGSYYIGRDAFLSEDDARTAANQQRIKKIASLEKQIAKLRAQAFVVVDR